MKVDTLKGMAVVSISDGAKLGRIDDLLFDMRPPHVAAFRISGDGQHALIPFDQVRSIGSGAVTVPGREVVRWARAHSDVNNLPNLRDLSKLKVVDEAGAFLGTAKDVEIDPQNGCITRLQVHRGGVLGIGGETQTIAAGDIVSIGAEVMVVRASSRSR